VFAFAFTNLNTNREGRTRKGELPHGT